MQAMTSFFSQALRVLFATAIFLSFWFLSYLLLLVVLMATGPLNAHGEATERVRSVAIIVLFFLPVFPATYAAFRYYRKAVNELNQE